MAVVKLRGLPSEVPGSEQDNHIISHHRRRRLRFFGEERAKEKRKTSSKNFETDTFARADSKKSKWAPAGKSVFCIVLLTMVAAGGFVVMHAAAAASSRANQQQRLLGKAEDGPSCCSSGANFLGVIFPHRLLYSTITFGKP